MDFSETIVAYGIKIGRCSQLNGYCKFTFIRENFIFANIREFDHSRIKKFTQNICINRVYIRNHRASRIKLSANKFSTIKSRNKEHAKIKWFIVYESL